MSITNNREDWRWISLFDPKTGNNLPAIDSGIDEGYEVEETYEEANANDGGDDFTDETALNIQEEEVLVTYGDDDEDEEA